MNSNNTELSLSNNIPAKVILENNCFTSPISFINCNICSENGIFPKDFQELETYMKNDRNENYNDQPINTLSSLSTIFESYKHDEINKYFYAIFCKFQCR